MICIEVGVETKVLCLFYVKITDEMVLRHLAFANQLKERGALWF